MLAAFDLFFFFRRFLMIACAVYAIVRLSQSMWRWWRYLFAPRRSAALARHYLLLQVLRIRVRRFATELAQIAALAAVLVLVIWLHHRLGLVG